MAARNKCIAVLITTDNPPNLILREQEYDPIDGSALVQVALASSRQVVACYNVRDLDGDAGGPFWDEFSGNSRYRVQSTFDGVDWARQDLTGPTQGVFTRQYFSNAAPPAAQVDVENNAEDLVMAQGTSWLVYEDGQGSEYATQLEAARILASVPT